MLCPNRPEGFVSKPQCPIRLHSLTSLMLGIFHTKRFMLCRARNLTYFPATPLPASPTSFWFRSQPGSSSSYLPSLYSAVVESTRHITLMALLQAQQRLSKDESTMLCTPYWCWVQSQCECYKFPSARLGSCSDPHTTGLLWRSLDSRKLISGSASYPSPS